MSSETSRDQPSAVLRAITPRAFEGAAVLGVVVDHQIHGHVVGILGNRAGHGALLTGTNPNAPTIKPFRKCSGSAAPREAGLAEPR